MADKEKTEPKAPVKDELLAKAGKRSAKAAAEAEAKQEKELRKKEAGERPAPAAKSAAKPPKTRAERAGRKYREAAKQVDGSKSYSLNEAIDLAVKNSPTAFDATVEMHINLNVDPKQADQNVRGMVVLPAGTGKQLRVAALTDDEAEAQAAGAEKISADDILAQLAKEVINFDVLVASPAMMPRLAKYARLLGPKGLMPNPKSGTVSADVAKAVKSAKTGQVEFRVDSYGIVHLAIGKVGFGPDKLAQNAEAILASLRSSKPASVKGNLLKSGYVTTTMGPSVKITV